MVKRELWEHHNLWRVPLIMLVMVILANIGFSGVASWLGLVPPEISTGVMGVALGSLGSIVFFVFSFLVIFYLVDCLYAERKDKSILFWRSVPTSDTLVVLTKLFVAAVIIPLIIWFTIITAQLLSLVIQKLTSESTGNFFSLLELGLYWRNLLIVLMLTMLWSLPLLSWILFCSSWSRRTPFIAAISIPVVIILLDRIFSIGLNLGGHITDRIPFGLYLGGDQRFFLSGLMQFTSSDSNAHTGFGNFFLQPGLWFGLLIAFILTALTIWVRRWRDDT